MHAHLRGPWLVMCQSALAGTVLHAGALCAAALPHAAANSASAQVIHKCTLDGKISYSDRPCDGAALATTLAAPVPAPAPSPGATSAADAARARQRAVASDGKRAEALASDGKQAEALARARRQRELQQDRADDKAARQAAVQRKRCDRLRLTRQWAEDDVRRATPATIEQARIKAARAADSLSMECAR